MSDTQIPRSLLKHSDDAIRKARDEEAEIAARQEAQAKAQSKFERYFRDHIDGRQMSAALRLLHKIEATHQSGAAVQSYDGMPVTAVTYGAKTPSDHIMNAFDHIRRCKAACRAVPSPYDLYWYLERALVRDLAPQELADELVIPVEMRFGQKRRRQIAINIIQQATRLIESVE